MAIVPLSLINRTNRAPTATAFSSAGMPEWKNVESPMTAAIGTALREAPGACCWASQKPVAIEMDAPMSRHVSIARWLMARV